MLFINGPWMLFINGPWMLFINGPWVLFINGTWMLFINGPWMLFGRAWLAQLVRSSIPGLRSPALPKFEYLCNLLFLLSQLSFPSLQGRLMSTSICWELTCDGLVSRLGGVKASHPLNTTETGYKRRLHWPLGSSRI